MTTTAGPEAEPSLSFRSIVLGVWRYYFPSVERFRTDRAVRRLVAADLLFLLYVTIMASDSATAFAAFVAANVVGAVTGLLFAVPKQNTVAVAQSGSSQAVAGPATPRDAQAGESDSGQRTAARAFGMTANTSLEEVSDWLTKTIIGAGLVSWRQILSQLDQSGGILGHAMTTADPEITRAVGVALIVGPAGLGWLIAYLWFARHWSSELMQAQEPVSAKRDAAGLQQKRADVAPTTPNISPPAPSEGAPPPTPSAAPAAAGLAREPGSVPRGAAAPAAASETTAFQLRQAAELKYAQMRSAPFNPADWARGMFGRASSISSEKFGKRTLTAAVRKLDAEWFEVALEIIADPKPETEAIFFLHNTFPQPTPTVGFDEAGVARLKVTAYGAFTVGALTDDGTTQLELNLAALESAPAEFRNR